MRGDSGDCGADAALAYSADLAFDLFMTLDRVTVDQSGRWLQAWNGQVPDTLTGPRSR
jgi:hypothetical protein